jgi:uncharacterized protein (DUF2252 family)
MLSVPERIIAFNSDLLPDMVKLKYEAMAENIYRFYRGTCHLFYEDLSKVNDMPSSPHAWICGDLHLENFGSYKADNRLVYFDLNDFDEALLAPCAWEVVRMVTSIFIAFENLEIEEEKALNMAQMFLKNYSASLAKGKAISIDPRTAKGIVSTFLTTVDKRKQKELLQKLTASKKHEIWLSIDQEKHFKIDKTLRKALTHHINEWIKTSNDGPFNFEVIDCVFRVAGTGSVGVRRYLFLLKSLNTKNKYLLLDMKQAKASSVQPYVSIKQPQWDTDADRVIQIQQRMQYVSAALLGTTVFEGVSYVLQEMQPMEDRINFELIKDRYKDIHQVIDDMALLTAWSQLRSSGRQGSAIGDKLIAHGKDGKWQDTVLNYSIKYAKQVKKDYKEYLKSYNEGELKESKT